ncbi:MAG: cell division protein ZapE [Pseudomonadota bacterium]
MPTGPIHDYRARVAAGDLRPDPAQKLAAEKLQSLHRILKGYAPRTEKSGLFGRKREPVPGPEGLYLFGGVGRGKSMLMDLFFDASEVEKRRRAHFHAFMQETHARLNDWRAAHKDDRKAKDPLVDIAAEIAETTWLLCFDEFIVNNIADAMILGRLFEQLFAQGVVVVATSNFAPDDLYKNGLQRDRFLPFIAELKRHMDVLELESPIDHRQVKMKGVAVWRSPPGPDADAALERAFLRLADGAKGRPDVITVQGREIVTDRAAHGVAWFEFEDLCAQPLGPADYLAIAERYETVILSDIPKMSPAQRNEARRFMTLIDALYEQRTRLIASAEGAPHALYPAGDGAFEFQRTISRLVEMQTEKYAGGESGLHGPVAGT